MILINAPQDYPQTLGELPETAVVQKNLDTPLDFIHFFTTERSVLEARFPELKAAMKKNGLLWVSWPKKASKVPTDVDENIVRDIGLANGLVDVKVAAIDKIWSGLKFVYRVADRT